MAGIFNSAIFNNRIFNTVKSSGVGDGSVGFYHDAYYYQLLKKDYEEVTQKAGKEIIQRVYPIVKKFVKPQPIKVVEQVKEIAPQEDKVITFREFFAGEYQIDFNILQKDFEAVTLLRREIDIIRAAIAEEEEIFAFLMAANY